MSVWILEQQALPHPGTVVEIMTIRPAEFKVVDDKGNTTWAMFYDQERLVAWRIPGEKDPFFWHKMPGSEPEVK